MILGGLSTSVALSVINRSYDSQIKATASDPMTARRIATFLDRIGAIETPEDLVNDYEVFSFVMEAFDLGEQTFGKAMMQRILDSDIADTTSLAYRMTDPRFRELYQVMDFPTDGSPNPNTLSPAWQQHIVARFLERSYISTQAEANPDLGQLLHFRAKAPSIHSWYDVTKDKQVAQVLRTALGLPDSIASLDLDQQIRIYASKMDLADFQDPETLAGLERRFAALSDAQRAVTAGPQSPILSLFQSNSQFAIVTLDIAGLRDL